jgi:ribosome biogenesis GTPase / thiamine phosphate phosphatase
MRRSSVIEQGEVVEIVGRRVRIALDSDPAELRVWPVRGVKAIIGDRIRATDGVITEVLPRTTELCRGNKVGVREICANATALLCVCATLEPPFRAGLVDRVLASAEAAGIIGGIILNKCDQGMPEPILERLALYEHLGYPIFLISALQQKGLDTLTAFLKQHTTVLVGHSGVGKTSLFNALIPGMNRTVGVLDEEGRGRHTTTGGVLLNLPDGGRLIDLPGVREFGLEHIDRKELRRCFPELAVLRCKFGNCLHNGDEGCVADREDAPVDEMRLESYRKLLGENAG